MSRSTRKILMLLVFIVLSFIALLLTSINLPFFYESNFPLSDQQFSSVLDSLDRDSSFSKSTDYCYWLDKIIGPIYVTKYFIDEKYNTENLRELISHFAMVDIVDEKPIVHLYARKYEIIKKLNQLLYKEKTDKILADYFKKLDQIKLKLKHCDENIEMLKKDFLDKNLYEAEISKQAVSSYFNSMLESTRSQQILDLVTKTPPTTEAYLSIAEIAQDPVVQKLVLSLSNARKDASQLRAELSSDDYQVKAIMEEVEDIKRQLYQQIQIVIKRIQNQANINNTIENKLLSSLQKYQNKPLLPIDFFNKLHNAVYQKVSLIEQEADLNAKIANVRSGGLMEPLLVKHRFFEALCQNCLLLNLFILFVSLFYFTIKLFSCSAPTAPQQIITNFHSNNAAKSANELNYKDNNTEDKPLNIVSFVNIVISRYLKYKHRIASSVAFFGQSSEIAAVKFISYLRVAQPSSKILLLDFCGSVAKGYNLNNKLNIQDFSGKKKDLQKLLITDDSVQADMLLWDNCIYADQIEYVKKASDILHLLYEKYNFIIFIVSQEPPLCVDCFLRANSHIAIMSSQFNNLEAKSWSAILNCLGFENISYLDISAL